MKKTLFAVLALAAVAACNKAEVVEQSAANAIAFDNAFVDNAVKSVSDPSFTNANLFSDFAVYGFVEGASLFDGNTVSKSIDNGDLSSVWKYEGTQYWITGAKYNFCAVAPKTAGGWTKTSCDVEDNAINTVLSFINNGITDLLYAEHAQIEGAAEGNAAVDFSFNHILSKVKFSFENAYNASSATIKVKDIKITNAYQTGNVALNANTVWSGQNGTLELAFGMATDNEATQDAEDTEVAYDYGKTYESQKELFLIPNAVPTNTVDQTDEKGNTTQTTVNGYKVTFNVVLLVSNQVIDTYAHTAYVNFTPAPGCCYDIKAVINPENIDPEHDQEPIEFTVNALPSWTAADPNPEI